MTSPTPTYVPNIFVQPVSTTDVGARVFVSPYWEPVQTLAAQVYKHLASSPRALAAVLATLTATCCTSSAARAAFVAKFPVEIAPTPAMVQSYLLNSPPAIIVAPLDEDDTTDFVGWGYVEKGTSQAAMRNELFVDSELTSALISVYDPTSRSPEDTSIHLNLLRFLWVVTVLHELQHCLTKHFFSANFITPLSATPGSADGKGNGEVGHRFEVFYFGFITVAEWDSTISANTKGRMWDVKKVLAREGGVDHELPNETIDNMLQSLSTQEMSVPNVAILPTSPLSPGSIRRRLYKALTVPIPITAPNNRRARTPTGLEIGTIRRT